MTAVLEAHGFGKRYRRRPWALRSVDLTVPEGSITALVGPNGSGKSTLIRSWIGFERPTEGRLVTGGIDPQKDRKGAVARVGYVPAVAVPLPRPHDRRHIALRETLRVASTARWRRATSNGSSIPLAAPRPASCPAASRPRSGWRWPSRRGPRSCSSTNPSRASTRSPGGSSST